MTRRILILASVLVALVATIVLVVGTNDAHSTSSAHLLAPVLQKHPQTFIISGRRDHRLKSAAAPTVGEVLTTTNGNWLNNPTRFTYQWQRCAAGTCTDIPGAADASYTIVVGDIGNSLDVVITAHNAGGSARSTSAETGTVQAVGSTFGTTTVGSLSGAGLINDRKRVNKYTIGSGATVTSLSIYLAPTTVSGSQTLKGVIYADSAGAPAGLLATSQEITFSSTQPAGWYDLTFSSPVALGAGTFWIGVITGATGGVAGYRYADCSNCRDSNTNLYTDGPSDPFGAPALDGVLMSLYANYSAAADVTAPSVPTGMTATPGDTQITLGWNASTDVDSPVAGYNVLRNGAVIAHTVATSYTDTGLTNGVSYSYSVQAFDAAGNTSADSGGTPTWNGTAEIGAATTVCDKYVATAGAFPAGNDANSGAVGAPWLTIDHMVATLTAGQTGCLEGGTYGSSSDHWTISTANVTITAAPGVAATVQGFPEIAFAATGATISYLNLSLNNVVSGSGCPGQSTVTNPVLVNAPNATVTHDNVFDSSTAAVRSTAINVGTTGSGGGTTGIGGVSVTDNRVHDYGCPNQQAFPAVSVRNTHSSTFSGNWIYSGPYNTAGYGSAAVQFFDSAVEDGPHDNVANGNVMDNVGLGIFITEEGALFKNNTTTNNVITTTTRYGGFSSNDADATNTFTNSDGTGTHTTWPCGGSGDCGFVTTSGLIAVDPQYITANTGSNVPDFRTRNAAVSTWGLWNGDVTGSTVSATPVAPTAPSHVPTWDREGADTSPAPASLYRQWVSIEESGNSGPAAALSDCHAGGVVYCKVMPYVDTNIYYPGTPASKPAGFPGSIQESWYSHVPGSSSDRLWRSDFGGGYLLNPANTAAQAWWKNEINTDSSLYGPSVDGLFSDDMGGIPLFNWFANSNHATAETSTNEITTEAAVTAAHVAMANAITTASGGQLPQVANSIPDCGNEFEPTGQQLGLLTGATKGLLAESCPTNGGAISGLGLEGILDDAAWIDAHTNGYIVLLAYSNAAGNAAARRIQQAMVMAMWDATNTNDGVVDWANLEQDTTNVSVWPEEGIVPGAPVQTMGDPGSCSFFTSGSGVPCPSGGHHDLQVATGVFRREFTQCYNQGAPIGPCAVLVNQTGSPVTVAGGWLTQSYTHSVTFNGGDVQSGGTVNLGGATFTAGSSTIPAGDALILDATPATPPPPPVGSSGTEMTFGTTLGDPGTAGSYWHSLYYTCATLNSTHLATFTITTSCFNGTAYRTDLASSPGDNGNTAQSVAGGGWFVNGQSLCLSIPLNINPQPPGTGNPPGSGNGPMFEEIKDFSSVEAPQIVALNYNSGGGYWEYALLVNATNSTVKVWHTRILTGWHTISYCVKNENNTTGQIYGVWLDGVAQSITGNTGVQTLNSGFTSEPLIINAYGSNQTGYTYQHGAPWIQLNDTSTPPQPSWGWTGTPP